MLEDTEVFLQTLFALCEEGYLTLTAIHPDGFHPTPSRHLPFHDEAALHNSLIDLQSANDQGWGAFFGVATRPRQLGRWRRGGQADVLMLPAVFVDLDVPVAEGMQRLRAHDPPPSCVVASGGGLHAYWWLETPTSDWVRATQALQHLRQRLGADRSFVSQLLRVPGSLNTKPTRQNAPCSLLDLQSTRYPLTTFLDRTSCAVETSAEIKAVTDVRLQSPSHRMTHNRNRSLNWHLLTAVESVLVHHYRGFRQRNGWIAANCPCGHKQDRPGKHFAFNPSIGVGVCLGRHGQLLLKDLCHVLDLPSDQYGGFYTASPIPHDR